MAEQRIQFIAYAYEAEVGDVVDGRTVTARSEDGDTITLSRTGVDDKAYGRQDEIELRRLVSASDLPAGWVRDGDAVGTPEALKLLAAARNGTR